MERAGYRGHAGAARGAGQAARYATFLADAGQVMIAWGGPTGGRNRGHPGLLMEANSAKRLLSFSEWLPAEEAQYLDRDTFQLRQQGQSFNRTTRTLRGDHVEIEGARLRGRAMSRSA